MTVERPSPDSEDQALAKCERLGRASPATALVQGKQLEARHGSSERVLGRLAEIYTQLGLTAEATRVAQRLDELRSAPVIEISDVSSDDDLEWDEATIAVPSENPSSAPPAAAGSGSLPPLPRPPPIPGSLPPRPAPPPVPSGAPLRSPGSSRPPPPPSRPPSAVPTPGSSPPPPAEPVPGSRPPPPASPAPGPASAPPSSPRPPSSQPPPRSPIAVKTGSTPAQPRVGGDADSVSQQWRVPLQIRWALSAVALVVLVGFGIYSRVVDQRLRGRLADAEQQLARGTPEALAGARQLLGGSFRLSWPVRAAAHLLAGLPADRLPTEVEAALLGLEHAVSLRLLGAPHPGNLKDAADHAELLGAPPDRVAFARVQHALDSEDRQKALSLVEAWDERTTEDPYFQLVTGAAQARVGQVAQALERFDRAGQRLSNSLTPLLVAAELAVCEDPAGASERLDALEQYDARIAKVSARALRGLRWALQPVDDGPRLLPEEFRLAVEQYAELPELLGYAPAVVRVKEAVIAEAPLADLLKRATSGARHPGTLLMLGRVALAGGETQQAETALQHLREVAPQHREIGRFALDLALSIDDLAQARLVLKDDTTNLAIVRAVRAYEQLDPEELQEQLPQLQDAARAEALLASAEVLIGKRRLGEKDSDRFEDAVWGWAVQVDAAIYQGELSRAERLLSRWNEPGASAFLARQAQLTRYRGDAETALRLARKAGPEKHARAAREELLALVAAGRAKEALTIVNNEQRRSVLGPLEKWMQNFVLGKAKGGRAALGTIGYVPMPQDGTPLSVRLMAARAMFTSGDLRYKSIDVLLEAAAPHHPEFALARLDLEEP